jgi:hypothetical protein
MNCYAQDSLYVRILGLSTPPVDGEERDRQEAILDAKEKALSQQSEEEIFDIKGLIENEKYTITDRGYTKDSTYQVILEGWSNKKHGMTEGQKVLIGLGLVALFMVLFVLSCPGPMPDFSDWEK